MMTRWMEGKDNPNKIWIEQQGSMFQVWPTCCGGAFRRRGDSVWSWDCTCGTSTIYTKRSQKVSFILTEDNSEEFFQWVKKWTGITGNIEMEIHWPSE